MSGGNWFPGLAGSRYASRERVRQMLDIIANEAVTQALEQALEELDEDTVAALELKASQLDLDAHVNDTGNPHSVTAGQVGADPSGTASGAVSAHESASNPHPQYSGAASEVALANHVTNTGNPHSVTAAQVGLGNVDNTADLDKPISTATQSELDQKASNAAVSSLGEVVGDLEEVVDEIHTGVLGVQSLTGAGALSLLAMTHLLTADDEEQAITLEDGVIGQLKVVVLAAAGGGDSSVLAPETTVGWTDATFDAAGQALTLAWTPAGWAITANQGATVT